MINGFSRFDPFIPVGPFDSNSDNSLEKVTDRINEAIETIRTWQTIMNVMAVKQWQDPITKDVHIVLRYGKLLSVEHVGEAAEVLKSLEREEKK